MSFTSLEYRLYPYVRLSASGLSNWLAVTIGIWRSIAVALPMKAVLLLTTTRAKLGITFLCVVCFVLTAPSFLLSTYSREIIPFYDEEWVPIRNYTLYFLVETKERYHDKFFAYSVVTLIVTILPCAILLITTGFLIFSLQRASRNRRNIPNSAETQSQIRDRKLTLMLLVVLVTFVISYLPDGICVCILIYFFEEFMSNKVGWDNAGFCKRSILDGLFPLITNGMTFFIYLTMSENFRQAARETLDCITSPKLIGEKSVSSQISTV